jgi:hypothetical protein
MVHANSATAGEKIKSSGQQTRSTRFHPTMNAYAHAPPSSPYPSLAVIDLIGAHDPLCRLDDGGLNTEFC